MSEERYKIKREGREFIEDDFRFTVWKNTGVEIEEFDKEDNLIRRITIPFKPLEKALNKILG